MTLRRPSTSLLNPGYIAMNATTKAASETAQMNRERR